MNTPTLIDDPTQAGRYLAGQLSEAECAAYEAHFAANPQALAELEATARLKIGLQRLRRSGALNELLAAPAPNFNRTWVLAMAAGIAAAVIGLSVWFPRAGSLTAPMLGSSVSVFKDHNGRALSVAATTPLFRTRAEKYDGVIDLPAVRGAIRLRVLPSHPADGARYQASLARLADDDNPQRAVSLSDLRPSGDDGFVDVYADSSLLTPGRYQLTLTRQTSGAGSGDSDTFVIKVNSSR